MICSIALNRTSWLLVALLTIWMQWPAVLFGQQDSPPKEPEGADAVHEWLARGAVVRGRGKTLLLEVTADGLRERQVVIPRLNAPIRRLQWLETQQATLKLVPELAEWVIGWEQIPPEAKTIEIVFDQPPLLPADAIPVQPEGDGSIMLHAFQAATFGEKLRYEPQPHKNTVGYWTVASDYATWKFTVDQPGTYSVAVLQGCGAGQGGSDAQLSIRQRDDVHDKLVFQTIDTGHFQNFRWNHLGHVSIPEPGTYELKIEPARIAKNALFDVRMIHLVLQAQPRG